jgi:hypothetical protein
MLQAAFTVTLLSLITVALRAWHEEHDAAFGRNQTVGIRGGPYKKKNRSSGFQR